MVREIRVVSAVVPIGESVTIAVELANEGSSTERLLVDLRVPVVKADGSQPEVVKLKELDLAPHVAELAKTISLDLRGPSPGPTYGVHLVCSFRAAGTESAARAAAIRPAMRAWWAPFQYTLPHAAHAANFSWSRSVPGWTSGATSARRAAPGPRCTRCSGCTDGSTRPAGAAGPRR